MDDEIPLQGGSHASSSHEASLEPILKRREDLCKHNVHTHFPKVLNFEICQRTKITKSQCRRRNGGAVPRAENFGDLITADHKVLSENCEYRNSRRYAVVVQGLASQWIKAYSCKTKTSQKTQRSLQKFLGPDSEPKVIYTDNSLEFGKACEDLSWNHCTSTPHRSETNGIAERAVRRVEEGTSAVLLQSGLKWKLVGRFYGMWDLSAKRHRSIIWWEDALWKTFRAIIERTDYSIRFIGWVFTYNCEGPVKNPSIWKKKSYLDCSSDMHCTRGEFGRVTYWLQILRSWRRWTHRKSTRKDSINAEEVIFPKEKGVFTFPIGDGRIKPLGGDQDLRTYTLIRQRLIRGESHVDFLGESEGLFHHFMTHFRMPMKWLMIFGPCREASYTAITLNPESNSSRREKNHSVFHWNTLMYPELLIRIWTSSKRNESMIIRKSMGHETCRILGQVSLNSLCWKKNLQKDMWSGGD